MFWSRKAKKIKPVETDDLEKKVDEANKGMLNKVKIVERFKTSDFSASMLWNYFSAKEVTNLGEKLDYNEKFTGLPQMKRLEDGSLCPIVIAFDAVIDGSKYRVVFDKTFSEELNVSIECDFKNVGHVRDLLDQAKQKVEDVILISKKYDDVEPLKCLYKFLTSNAKSMKIKASKHNSTPKMIIDNELGLFPIDANIHAVLDGCNYVFSFSSDYRPEVVVECLPDKASFIRNLFDSISVRKVEEGEKEIRSLDFYISVKEYHWGMVGGLKNIRKELEQYIEWPLENPELFRQLDSSMPRGVLLIGPPGNGKTTIAKILANETDASFYAVSAKDINSMWVGGTEKNWGRLFRQARQDVKDGKCAIIFIDEIDGLYTDREKMDKYSRISFGQFCQEMEGISDLEKVIVIGATNRHEDLDPALVRPGRFTKKIYIGNPDAKGREEILKIYTNKKPIAKDFKINYLVQLTEDYSGAQLKELCDAAAFNAINRYSTEKGIEIKDIKGDLIKEITIEKQDFDFALNAQKIMKMKSNS